jgi:hypothetical protein
VKCNVNLDHTEKIRSSIAEVLDKNALAIRNPSIRNEVDIKPKVNPIVTRREICKTRLEKIMSEVHDIENNVEREKPVKIEFDVDLYQMEEP